MTFKTYFKRGRIELDFKKYAQLRRQVYDRCGGFCEQYNCGNYFEYQGMHLHHIRKRSQGGDDIIGNVAGLCWECHRKIHDGHIRYKGEL